MLHFQSYQLVL